MEKIVNEKFDSDSESEGKVNLAASTILKGSFEVAAEALCAEVIEVHREIGKLWSDVEDLKRAVTEWRLSAGLPVKVTGALEKLVDMEE
jgi:hypothetical protein